MNVDELHRVKSSLYLSSIIQCLSIHFKSSLLWSVLAHIAACDVCVAGELDRERFKCNDLSTELAKLQAEVRRMNALFF